MANKEIIEKEIEERKQKWGEDWWSKYFNNFAANLPFGWRRDYKHLTKEEKIQYKRIDEVVEQSGIDMEKLKKLQEAINAHKPNGTEILKEIYQLAFPAYIKLREAGFSHYELVN